MPDVTPRFKTRESLAPVPPLRRKRPNRKPHRLTRTERAVRALVEARSGGACEIGVEGVCHEKANHFHHRLRRSQGGADVVDNFLHLCAFNGIREGCHEYVHREVAEAVAMGWIVPSTSPDAVALRKAVKG